MNSVAGNRERPVNFEHRKLCRVSHGTKVAMGSTPPSFIADLSKLSTNDVGSNNGGGSGQQMNNLCMNFYDHPRRKRLETVDSDPCYSSDGEHSNLSRNASTNSDIGVINYTSKPTPRSNSICISGRPFANNENLLMIGVSDETSTVDSEYSGKVLVTPHDSGYSDTGDNNLSSSSNGGGGGGGGSEYGALLEYTLKLGYSENQLRTVLQRLATSSSSATAQIGQNNLLAELIKLGQDVQETPPSSNQQQCTNSSGSNQNGSFSETTSPQNSLRSVVIDGSNVAITHGHKEVFSCKGIKECVDWFKKRGHNDLKVFVPQFRKETPRSDLPITDQHILFELEQEGILIWTPSRRLGGRRIVCHDDRYVVKTASDKDAVIVSNDEYRDMMKENPEYKKVIEERLLMYSFVDGKFMPPDDPLGRYGPKLDQFLRKGCANAAAPTCPYGRKCTYGNKCKYSHPERPGGGYKSVTDRLRDHADYHRRISPSNSLQSPPRAFNAESTNAAASNTKPVACRSQSLNQQALIRQHSPSPGRQSPLANNQLQQQIQARKTLSQTSNSLHQSSNDAVDGGGSDSHQHLSKRSSNPESATNCGGVGPGVTNERPLSSSHQPLFCVGTDGFLMPPSLQGIWQTSHQPVGRNLSAPGVNSSSRMNMTGGGPSMLNRHYYGGGGFVVGAGGFYPHIAQQQQQRKNSISDSQINLVGQNFYVGPTIGGNADLCGSSGDVFHSLHDSGFATPPSQTDANWYVPSTTVWGPLENSSAPIFVGGGSSWPTQSSQPPPPRSVVTRVNTTPLSTTTTAFGGTSSTHAAATATTSLKPSTSSFSPSVADQHVSSLINNEKRMKLYYHLSQLFPGDAVAAVLNANPSEYDPQKLCPQIIAIQNQQGAIETGSIRSE